MFNDYYFDRISESLNFVAVQASAKQLNIISNPFNDGSVIEATPDLKDNPYWTSYSNMTQTDELWTESREVSDLMEAQNF